MKTSALVLVLMVGIGVSEAQSASAADVAKGRLVDRLTGLRERVLNLEQNLIDSLKTQKQARANIKKIQLLIKLQHEERAVGKKRLTDLESTVAELESRRLLLRERIKVQQDSIRKFLMAIEESAQGRTPLAASREEKLEAPRRKVMANLVDRGLKEIEALRVDLADAEKLEGRIQEEKQQFAYVFQDLNEQESVLELNRQLQSDLLQTKHQERMVQLENYRKLKSAEAQVEDLIGEFNSRLELEHEVERERQASRQMHQGFFAGLKGKLPLPVADGRIVSVFGRSFDPKSRLYVFKKGIDVTAPKSSAVRAVSAGKVAFSGELPDYGRVTIIDHGDHYYSLCAHLGELTRKVGDSVATGDQIGQTDGAGSPVYFEIRARNVAVNPLQWVAN